MRSSVVWSIAATLVGTIFHQIVHAEMSTLNKNDPWPIYSSLDAHNFLHRYFKECCCLKGHAEYYGIIDEVFGLSISPFHQKASRGRNFDQIRVPLGDLIGRWHMLGMLYGELPEGATLEGTQLGCCKEQIFGVPPDFVITKTMVIFDCMEEVGFLSMPVKYRNTGLRYQVDFRPFGRFCTGFWENLGISLFGGVAEIKQTLTQALNLTEEALDEEMGEVVNGILRSTATTINECLTECNVSEKIFREIGFPRGICDFRQATNEDLRLNLWWRDSFVFNEQDFTYPLFILTPFVSFDVTFPIGKKKVRNELFSLPSGNDDHWGIGMHAGLTFDFIETIEVGFHGGFVQFLEREIENFRLPTSNLQFGIFPFSTTVKVTPGRNFHMAAWLHAHHFIDRLSFLGEFVFISHKEDSITQVNPDPAFKPKILECLSKFESMVFNTTLNYDISAHAMLGCIIQWPWNQRNAYRSTTYMATMYFQF